MDALLYSATLVLGGLIGFFKAGIFHVLLHSKVQANKCFLKMDCTEKGSLMSLFAGLGSGSLVYWASLELKRGHCMPLICNFVYFFAEIFWCLSFEN
jgi:uncharacterized membrane protein (UPF0136 family)